jgi:predicted secreted protein
MLEHKTITKTQADNQGSLTMSSGDMLLVMLPSNVSTGFAWNVVTNPGFPLKLVRHDYIPPEDMRPGAAGHEEFLFAAASKRTFAQGGWLRLLYLRSFEQEISISTRSEALWQIQVTVDAAVK